MLEANSISYQIQFETVVVLILRGEVALARYLRGELPYSIPAGKFVISGEYASLGVYE